MASGGGLWREKWQQDIVSKGVAYTHKGDIAATTLCCPSLLTTSSCCKPVSSASSFAHLKITAAVCQRSSRVVVARLRRGGSQVSWKRMEEVCKYTLGLKSRCPLNLKPVSAAICITFDWGGGGALQKKRLNE
jgi:hypothetical protein